MIIYMAHCPSTHSFYYGKTVKSLDHRKRQHINDAAANRNNGWFHKSIRKYGADAFQWYVLETCQSKEELAERERFWISLGRRVGQRILNLSDGGDGGGRTGVPGKPISPEAKAKIAQSLREYYSNRPGSMKGRVGNLAPQFGVKRSEEVRRRISESHKKIAKPHLVGARNPSARAVRCLTTGEVFPLASMAASKYGDDLSSIIKCCRGKVKSVKGKVYAYDSPGVFGWTQVQ